MPTTEVHTYSTLHKSDMLNCRCQVKYFVQIVVFKAHKVSGLRRGDSLVAIQARA